MLFMVIERFKDRDAKLIGERFERYGRMSSPITLAGWMPWAGVAFRLWKRIVWSY
jgi:hypothetical protein